jgi:hypothetical protein
MDQMRLEYDANECDLLHSVDTILNEMRCIHSDL